MSADTNDRRDYRLAIGFLAGATVSVGLMMWLLPRAAAELRERATDAAADLGHRAQAVRDSVAEGVVRGVQQVERVANAAKSTAKSSL